MTRYKNLRPTLLFVAIFAIVFVAFASFSVTYAYFSARKSIGGTFTIGSVGASWYNDGIKLSNDTTYQLSLGTMLVRGDTEGASVTKVDGTAGGVLRLVANSGISGQYARIQPKAIVGKNLLATPYALGSTTINGVTFTVNGNYTISVNGTATTDAVFNLTNGMTIGVDTQYTLGGCPDGGSNATYGMNVQTFESSSSQTAIANTNDIGQAVSFDSGDASFAKINIYVKQGTTASGLIFYPQLEVGGTATSYEKYIPQEDITSYLTFRYKTGSSTYTLGSANFWKKGADGWYYYINAGTSNIMTSGRYSFVCNNIVLDGSYPAKYLGRDIRITFTYQVLQAENQPVLTVWGQDAVNALGIVIAS